MASAQNDFSKGSVVGNIMGMAIPTTAAQLINLLYNVVDRIYIGYIPEHATLSLTGLGVCLPVITAVMAFANLFGMGGAPLCSIERGRGNQKEAEAIMGKCVYPHGDVLRDPADYPGDRIPAAAALAFRGQ